MKASPEEQARILVSYLSFAIHEQLGLIPLYPLRTESHLAHISLNPEQITRVILAAQLPLIGWDALISENWLAPYNSPHNDDSIDIFKHGSRPRGLAPISTNWWCASPGILRVFVHEREHIDVSEILPTDSKKTVLSFALAGMTSSLHPSKKRMSL
jgi:hypothetical protein